MITLSPLNNSPYDFEKSERKKKEASEKFKIFNYSQDCSFIIDNPQEENYWKMPSHERNMLNDIERENLEKKLTTDLLKASQKREQFMKFPNIQSIYFINYIIKFC